MKKLFSLGISEHFRLSGYFGDLCICPEIFQLIIVAQFFFKNVYDNIPIIDDYPLCCIQSFDMKRPFIQIFSHFFFNSTNNIVFPNISVIFVQ